MRNVLKGGNARTQIPPSLSRERLHREQGRRPDRGFRGGAAELYTVTEDEYETNALFLG